jgi:hypothetical protein
MLDLIFDWDKGKNWVIFDGNSVTCVSKSEFLTADFWSTINNKTVGVEKAHFQPRTRQSLAQVYTPDELAQLQTLVAQAAVQIFLLPESQSFRSREETKLEKKDDTVAHYLFFNAHPEIVLQRWPYTANLDRIQTIRKVVKTSNALLNDMRTVKYDHEAVTRVRTILSTKWDVLPETTKKFFELKKVHEGRPRERVDGNFPSLMAVYCIVYDDQQNLYTNKYGNFIGIDTCMRALSQNPYKSKKAGTGRSNIMHHRYKSLLDGVSQNTNEWRTIRAQGRRAIKNLIQLFRDFK